MFNLPLQTIPQETVEQIASKSDSAKVVIRQFTENLAKDPQGTLETLGKDALNFGIKVAIALLIYIVGAWLIRMLGKSIRKICDHKGTDAVLTNFIVRFVKISLTILLIVALIGTLGINTTSFAALLAAVGMAVGMALSGTMQNMAGGFLILLFKPFKAGDFIETQGLSGTVMDVTFVNTKIITPENKTIYIPNGTISSGNIINYTSMDIRRLEWIISVEYGTDANACREKLLELINADGRVLHEGEMPGASDPFVAIHKLDSSSVNFVVRAWARNEDFWNVYFDYNAEVYTKLPQHGVRFPFPQMDIHIKTEKDQ